jgi:allene oxide cyclase
MQRISSDQALVRAATLAVAVVVLALAVAAWGDRGSTSADERGGDGSTTVTVIEHATTDATTDTGAAGDSAGDILTFANDVFDASDSHPVGTDQGYCIRVVAGTSYECNYTTFLPDGQIVVEGPFYDAKDSTLAITGGTGRYRDADGTLDLRSLAGGTKFEFVFHITD